MAKAATKSRLAASGEELGEQLLQSVREMKTGLRGRGEEGRAARKDLKDGKDSKDDRRCDEVAR